MHIARSIKQKEIDHNHDRGGLPAALTASCIAGNRWNTNRNPTGTLAGHTPETQTVCHRLRRHMYDPSKFVPPDAERCGNPLQSC